MDLHVPFLTRKRLIELSGFTLPAVAKDRKRRVAALTYEQVRYFERHGCFDHHRVKYSAKQDQVLVVWKARTLGATALYTLLDLGVARLIGWMLQEQVPHKVIVQFLRRTAGRVLVELATTEAFVLVTHNAVAWMIDGKGEENIVSLYASYNKPLSAANTQRYPIGWLGMTERFISAFQKEFERPTVPLWNRTLTPAAALELEHEQHAL